MATKAPRRPGAGTICCLLALAALVLAVVLAVVLLGHTSIAHSYLRRTIWRDFSINTTLASGAAHDLSRPEVYGLPATTRQLAIPLHSGPGAPRLGAWYILPAEGARRRPAVLYLHGIAQTRGYHHRVGLYKVLLEAGHAVLAIDYRGFADSTDLADITETSVVEDAARALAYLREELGEEEVVVWGHSQGAAIAAHMVAASGGPRGAGLVLESPYSSLEEQVGAMEPWYIYFVAVTLVGLKEADMELR